MSSDFREGIAGFLAERLGHPVEVRRLHRHLEGFSWETYSIAVAEPGSDAERELIVHRVPRAGLLEPYDTVTQFGVRRALEDVDGVPVPRTLWIDPDGEATGRPLYVVEKIEGEVPTPWTSDAFFGEGEELRRDVARQLMEIAAALHAAPLDRFPLEVQKTDDTEAAVAVDRLRAFYEDEGIRPVPIIDWGLSWLEERKHETSGRRVLLHGDLRTGNYILREGRIVALLDWELVHVGDPVRDVAHVGLRQYYDRSRRACGLCPHEELIQLYEEVAGWEVPRAAVAFWNVYESVWAGLTHCYAGRLFETGRTHDVRYASLTYQNHHMYMHILRALRDAGR